jgi:hypothetical protein
VQLNLFSPGLEPGALQLNAQFLRSSLLLGSALELGEAFWTGSGAGGGEELGERRGSAAAAAGGGNGASRSRHIVESLWGSFRSHAEERLASSAAGPGEAEEAGVAYWRRVLTQDELGLHVDVRGFHFGLERAGEGSMRVFVTRSRASKLDHCATFTARSSLKEVFLAV